MEGARAARESSQLAAGGMIPVISRSGCRRSKAIPGRVLVDIYALICMAAAASQPALFEIPRKRGGLKDALQIWSQTPDFHGCRQDALAYVNLAGHWRRNNPKETDMCLFHPG